MRFSIIVPVYNVEEYIKKCIDSILKQPFNDYEIILVIDGSPDNSLKICEDYRINHSNIKVINKKNEGATSARKAGSEVAKGDYIVCVDGDDYISQDLLENVDRVIRDHRDVDIIAFGFYKFYEGKSDNVIVLNACDEGMYSDALYRNLIERYLFDSNSTSINSGCLLYGHPLKIIRRELFQKAIRELPSHLVNGEDIYFTALALRISKKLFIISKPLYYYRTNNNSLTQKRKPHDLVNINNVYSYLKRIDFISDVCSKMYFFRSALIIIRDFAKTSDSYSSFIEVVNNNYTPIDYNGEFIRLKLDFISRIKLMLITGSHYRLIYLLTKIKLL